MPLEHSASRAAFKRNLKTELAAGKPRKQALAIAYRVKREAGGDPPRKKKKRTLSPAQLAALTRGRAKQKAQKRAAPRRSVDSRAGSRESRPMARKKSRRKSTALTVHRSGGIKHRGRHHSRGASVGSALSLGGLPVGPLLAAAALGYAEKQGWSIPSIGSVGEAGSVALVAGVLHMTGVVRSKYVRDTAIGLGSIAVYEFMKGSASGSSGGGKAKQGAASQVTSGYEVR